MICLGFDTSNYTTSVAAYGKDTVISERRLLEVKHGERGLRQSTALFQHIKALPEIYARVIDRIDLDRITAVGADIRPRSCEGSYMPVFLAGKGYAEVAAKSLGADIFEFSHQDSHIMAGIYSAEAFQLLEKPFLSVHLSGGTTEILVSEYKNGSFENRIIGGTRDISAGQLIDRVGVALGLDFPCGRQIERLALEAEETIGLPVSTDGAYMNFSGAETRLLRMSGSEAAENISAAVLKAVAEALARTLNSAVKQEGLRDILLVGGVAANGCIREHIQSRVNAEAHFAAAEYSTDNALGTAVLTYYKKYVI